MNEANPTPNEWEIGLSSWIIQDGNYGNFSAGQEAEFALEFYPHNVRPSETKGKSARCLGDAKYEVNAQIVHITPEAWVLDFGICAYQESTSPDRFRVGQFVTAEIYLGIDPFFYFEGLYSLPGMLPLVYSWKVNAIRRQTAPYIEQRQPSGQTFLVRDKTKLGSTLLEKTDAWSDDGGNAEYVLQCTRFDTPPNFKITTSS